MRVRNEEMFDVYKTNDEEPHKMAASDGRIELKLTGAHPQQYKAYLLNCRLHSTHQPYGSM